MTQTMQSEDPRHWEDYQIGVKYDDGSWATINQAAPTGLRVGDRVRVTDRGLEMLR